MRGFRRHEQIGDPRIGDDDRPRFFRSYCAAWARFTVSSILEAEFAETSTVFDSCPGGVSCAGGFGFPPPARLGFVTAATRFAGISRLAPEPRIWLVPKSGSPSTFSIGMANAAKFLTLTIMPINVPERSTSAPPMAPEATGAVNCIMRKPVPAPG